MADTPLTAYQKLSKQKQALIDNQVALYKQMGMSDDEITAKVVEILTAETATVKNAKATVRDAILKSLRTPGQGVFLAGKPSDGAEL